MSITASTASDMTTIQVSLKNVGNEQRLVGLGRLNDGTVAPEYLQLFVGRNDGSSFSIARPVVLPMRPDPVAIPLAPGGRYDFTLSREKYQMLSRDRRVEVSKYLSEQCGDGCGIQVQLKVRIPYCREASSAPSETNGCWKGTLVSNDLRVSN